MLKIKYLLTVLALLLPMQRFAEGKLLRRQRERLGVVKETKQNDIILKNKRLNLKALIFSFLFGAFNTSYLMLVSYKPEKNSSLNREVVMMLLKGFTISLIYAYKVRLEPLGWISWSIRNLFLILISPLIETFYLYLFGYAYKPSYEILDEALTAVFFFGIIPNLFV